VSLVIFEFEALFSTYKMMVRQLMIRTHQDLIHKNLKKMMKSASSPALLKRWASVEILSEEEIPTTSIGEKSSLDKNQIISKNRLRIDTEKMRETKSDSEIILKRRTSQRRSVTRNATMSGLALKVEIKNGDNAQKGQFLFEKTHMVTSDGILVFSNAQTFMIETRIQIEGAKIEEIKNRCILLESKTCKYLLKFRNRTDRQKWHRTLRRQSQSRSRLSDQQIEFTPNKRRQIYFIDGPEEFRQETSKIQQNWNNALSNGAEKSQISDSRHVKLGKKLSSLSSLFKTCFVCGEE